MRLSYDKEADAAYIYLKPRILPKEVKKTISLNDDINLDFDKDNKMLGIEVLHASKVLPDKKSLNKIAA